MRDQIHQKLVRDRVPEILRYKGFRVHDETIQDDSVYYQELLKKLEEEVKEAQLADKDHLLEELGDVLSVIEAILSSQGLTKAHLTKQQKKKDKERGVFKNRVFLISTTAN